jgi:hypothetical protein
MSDVPLWQFLKRRSAITGGLSPRGPRYTDNYDEDGDEE